MEPTEVADLTRKHHTNDQSPAPMPARAQGLPDEPGCHEIIHAMLRNICESFDWQAGLVWRVDEHSNTLRQVDCWCDSPGALMRFCTISERTIFASGIGLCGRVWRSEQTDWVYNIIEEVWFLRATAAAEAGLHSAAGFPLWNADRVVGVMELYSDKIRNVDAGLLQAMDMTGRAIGPYVKRLHPEIELRGYPDDTVKIRTTQGRDINGHDRATETLQAIYRRLGEVQEYERHRLASELHDQIGQSLAILNLNLGFMKSQLPAERSIEVGAQLEDCMKLVGSITEDIRNDMMELRSAVLKSEGLIAALRWSVRRFQKRTGVATMVVGDEPVPRLPVTVEATLYRVAQECLSNLAKHARADSATITLDSGTRFARLTVLDDGIGFDVCAIPQPGQEQGWGTQIMRERLTAVGGRLYVESAMGRGTRIIAEIAR